MAAPQQIPLVPEEEHARRRRRDESSVPEIWALLDAVKDPEIPVVSIWELGILQDVEVDGDGVVVTITPTYSGCPAMGAIDEEIRQCLGEGGYADCRVVTRLSPAWSTSWIAPAAREKLRKWGIAPPDERADADIRCPHCGSANVRSISEFGSTACKALYQCTDCAEPFDYFKPF
jgi:ring-1,2-phenylacetyl-CoA epoxidase subunit PaaD